MSVLLKRKRGRPRLNESRVINNFDSTLIEEVKKFSVLYDREHPQYRNRDYSERVWERIAKNLKVSSNVVKNRMFQLRNRFNVEKRRIPSSWPLFENLAFLNDFTKQRRRYRAPVHQNTSSEEEEDRFDENNTNEMLMNGYITNDNINLVQQTEVATTHPERRDIPEQRDMPEPLLLNNELMNIDSELCNKKFEAFGEFLASSLLEMNEMQALHLVKKFTTTVVEYSKLEGGNKRTSNMYNKSAVDYLLN